jgi:hypothetical protein
MHLPSRTTPRRRRVRTLLAAIALVTTSSAAVAAAPASGYPEGTTIRPGSLERGADTPLLHREGRTIVDGPLRIGVDASRIDLLGRSAQDYVLLTFDENYENVRLVRVDRAGTATTLRRLGNVSPEGHLSTNGARVLLATFPPRAGTRLQVVDTRSGDVLRARTFQAPVQVLAHGRRRAVLTEWTSRRTRTLWWNPVRNTTRPISDRPGYRADIPQIRLGVWLGDPSIGGCQKLVRLDRPRTQVWRSCTDIVLELSPSAERMVTGDILSDGPGPRVIQVRRGDGSLLRTYRSEWFGFWRWETDRRLLLQVAGKEFVAAVRCTLRGCERASRLFPREGRDPWQVMRWQFPG